MQMIGRYEILDELGRGAMGVVYRARDSQIGRVVALKVIHTANASPQEIERFKQRFRREAQAAGRLSHPGIVTIHDIAEDSAGQPYLVMEFVEGKPLNLLLGPTHQLPFELLLDIGIQVAEALDYAHRNGIIHRDIKPPNIIVTQDGRAKLADFGIARLEGTELTQEGTSIGTPSYMSPEQFRGGPVDGRSDIFSLGAVLYWMFTGKKPFPGDTVTITSFQVAFENPVPPTAAKTGLPPEIDGILTRCLAKTPASRYATCEDLAADLLAVRDGKPLARRLAPPADRTTTYPLPNRLPDVDLSKKKPFSVEDSDPDAATRVSLSAAKQLKSQPVAPQRVSATSILAGAAALALLVLAAGLWFWRRPIVTQPQQPPAASAPQPAPVAPPGETSSPSPSQTEKPAGESAAHSSVPRNQPRQTAASTSGAPPPAATQPAAPAPSPAAAKAAPAEEKPAPPPAPVVFAKLDVDCKFPFKKGTLEIQLDGRPLFEEPLEERRNKLTLGIAANREAQAKDVPIPTGVHKLHVRLASKDGNLVWEDTLPVTVAKDTANRLEISFKDGTGADPGKKKLVLSLSTVK